MKASERFFENRDCKYFLCHEGMEGQPFNCLFCYCPMNPYEDCLGHPVYREMKNGRNIKVCTGCTFPHQAENYDKIMDFLREKLYR